jgi:hypothetical protein
MSHHTISEDQTIEAVMGRNVGATIAWQDRSNCGITDGIVGIYTVI